MSTISKNLLDSKNSFMDKIYQKTMELQKTFTEDILDIIEKINENKKLGSNSNKSDLQNTKTFLKLSSVVYNLEMEKIVTRIEKLIGLIDRRIDFDDEKKVASYAKKLGSFLTTTQELQSRLLSTVESQNQIVSLLEDRIDAMLPSDIAD